jgi:hypothetical protein
MPSNPEKLSEVYLPGMTADGISLTSMRQRFPDWFIPPSVTTADAWKQDDLTLENRFNRLAGEIGDNTGPDVTIIAHSFGAFESLDIIGRMIQSDYYPKKRKIDLVFTCAPGFSAAGWRNLLHFGASALEMSKNVATNEQHILYPLPEEFYKSRSLTGYPDLIPAFVDTEAYRQQRRSSFWGIIEEIGLPVESHQYLDTITVIDRKILTETDPAVRKSLLRKRADLLGPVIQSVFHGETIPKEVYEPYQLIYHEKPEDLAGKYGFYRNLISYYFQAVKTIYRGVPRRLNHLLALAGQSGTELNFHLLFMENDQVMKPADIRNILANFAGENIPVGQKMICHSLAHSSIGYFPDGLAEAMSKFKSR